MMRIKDESRWIARVLESILPVCERILILDDHSTDNTREICRRFDKVTVFESPFEGLQEVRDKNWLVGQVEQVAKAGDWVLAIDGDEELAAGSCDALSILAKHDPGPDAYRLQVLYLWDSPSQIRVDRLYSNFWRPSFFRLRPGARFRSATAGGFHCGNVPDPRIVDNYADAKILHWGYMHREDRIRKWNWYSATDPTNTAEGYDPRFPERKCYPHIAQGDVPEIPADAVLVHAGPLKLRPL